MSIRMAWCGHDGSELHDVKMFVTKAKKTLKTRFHEKGKHLKTLTRNIVGKILFGPIENVAVWSVFNWNFNTVVFIKTSNSRYCKY